MIPFVALGGATGLYVVWALAAYPLQVYVKENSIVYINQATNNPGVAFLYVIATRGAMLFSMVRPVIAFGLANLAILLVVSAVKLYAFTRCGVHTLRLQVSSSSPTFGGAAETGRFSTRSLCEDQFVVP